MKWVNKQKVTELFEELLEAWYWAEDYCIMESSGTIAKDQSNLEKQKEEYKRKIKEVLEEKGNEK